MVENRSTANQLWKPHIGVLEVGVLGATNLIPVKIKEGKGGSTDAYCVAKYGQKWVRTRTVVDSLSPKWNEQYTWEVFDPCTVITIGEMTGRSAVAAATRDSRIGKVRIRMSSYLHTCDCCNRCLDTTCFVEFLHSCDTPSKETLLLLLFFFLQN
ncbi:unnamed protein product [Coffea canephora]|uniref:C2 domain-containing protein n=1 Tax=Coffea canephora TaxID=49390 RepID=A0A068U883_COFCA|nr:unnamed protein product [Coffea canephora]